MAMAEKAENEGLSVRRIVAGHAGQNHFDVMGSMATSKGKMVLIGKCS
jgi:hypothetical protein